MVELGHQVVWSWPVVAEQFFIGLAAGAFFVAAVLHLFSKQKHEDISRLGFYLSPPAALIGLIILDLELGRPERGMNSLLNPATSMISRGSYGLAIFLAITVLTAAAWALPTLPLKSADLIKIGEKLKRPLEVVGLAFAIFSGLYAGLQLGAAVQRHFWETAFMPWLYFVSAVALGLGAIGLVAMLRGKQWFTTYTPTFAKYVLYLAIAQALVIVAHFATVEGASTEMNVLFSSATFLPALVVGVFIAGIIAPAILSYHALKSGKMAKGSALLLLILLMIGGFSVRAVFLFAGQII